MWGGGSSGKTTWAGKIAANTPATPSQTRANAGGNPWSGANGAPSSATVVAPEGFWDPVVPPQNSQQPMKKQASGANINNNNAKSNKNQKKKDGEGGKQKSRNEFEEWVTRALSELQAQVDIPTFVELLKDIESPYDVSTTQFHFNESLFNFYHLGS